MDKYAGHSKFGMCKRIFIRSVIYFVVLIWFGQSSQADPTEEMLIKMALVYKIAKFVEWPQSESSLNQMTVCALGDEERVEVFKTLESKQLGGRPIVVQINGPVQDLFSHCQIVYFDQSALRRNSLKIRDGSNALTISDAEHFADRGGIVELATEAQQIKIRINLSNSERQGLRIYAPLLQVSTVIMD